MVVVVFVVVGDGCGGFVARTSLWVVVCCRRQLCNGGRFFVVVVSDGCGEDEFVGGSVVQVVVLFAIAVDGGWDGAG